MERANGELDACQSGVGAHGFKILPTGIDRIYGSESNVKLPSDRLPAEKAKSVVGVCVTEKRKKKKRKMGVRTCLA